VGDANKSEIWKEKNDDDRQKNGLRREREDEDEDGEKKVIPIKQQVVRAADCGLFSCGNKEKRWETREKNSSMKEGKISAWDCRLDDIAGESDADADRIKCVKV